MDNFDGPPGHCLKVESHGGPGRYLPAASSYHSHPSPDPANLSFGSLNDDDDFGFTKKKAVRDPLSHRIIEKRRRDRMNNCLADLSRLIPTYYLKKGRGRIEKTEIIEMAIKYMKHLQAHACNQMENCEVTTKQEWSGNQMEQFHLGYQECMSETMQFLVESEGFFSGDSLCVRLMNHLTKHCEKILNSEGYVMRQNGASSSSSSGYHANSSSTGSSSDGNGNSSSHASESKDTLVTEESAYRSEDRTGTDEQDDKSGAALDSTAGMGSQLREILQQHSGPGGSGDRRCGGYSSGLSSNNSSSGDDSSRLYKFKSNMKHRFSADLEQSHQVRKKRRDSESSCGNYTDCEKDRVTPTGPMSLSRPVAHQEAFAQESNKIIDGGRDSPLLDKNHGSPSPVPKTENQGERNTPLRQAPEPAIGGTVPIFALNQNGSFYVPLTIEQSLVAPIMSGLSDVSPVLHPVSIYVNFCGPCPTVTPNNNINQQNSNQGTPILSHHPTGGRHNLPNHIFSNVSNFESGGYNGRHQTRISGERKRRETARPVTQYEEHRPVITNINDNLEKREPGEVDMREFHDAREARDHHLHDHPQRDVPRDLPPRHDQIHEARDTREQEQVHEVREVRNLRNIRDLREVREMREMRDPAQTVREFIDASSAYPNNTAYSRTHPHWAAAYHIQPKN